MKRLMLWFLAGLSLSATSGFAQTSWDGLARLKEGQLIQVVTRTGKPVEGAFRRFTADDLSVSANRGVFRRTDQSFTRPEVVSVKTRGGLRSVLIGLAIDAGAGAALAAALAPRLDKNNDAGLTKAGLAAITVSICGGGGALVGLSMQGYSHPIYRAAVN